MLIFLNVSKFLSDFVYHKDCQCPRDVIPNLQSLAKNIHELCIQDKNTCEDLQNSHYLSFGEFTVVNLFLWPFFGLTARK